MREREWEEGEGVVAKIVKVSVREREREKERMSTKCNNAVCLFKPQLDG